MSKLKPPSFEREGMPVHIQNLGGSFRNGALLIVELNARDLGREVDASLRVRLTVVCGI